MSKAQLKIADDLSLPLEAVTETFCIMAMRGKGKTHAASVMAEEMLKRQIPVVIYDPTGAWYGLKSSRDGKSAAFPVAVFGGEHADIPLEHTAGETVAKAIVDNRYAAILDCSLMRKGNRITFMAHFLEALYHHNREAMHLIVDEAHTIAPLSTREAGGDAPRALGAMEDIILQGRLRGIGCSSITQRPALLHTTIRTQSSTLVAMGMSGPHDIKAVMEWVKLQASEQQAADMLKSLPSLPRGDAWFWSPSAFDVFKRIHFRERETFDSSGTPKVGEARRVPKVLAAPDIQKLGEAIMATVQTAKANDPKLLKAEVAKLRQELAKAASVKPAATKVEVKRVEVNVLKHRETQKFESAVKSFREDVNKFIKQCDAIREGVASVASTLIVVEAKLEGARREGEPLAAPRPAPQIQPRTQSRVINPAPIPARATRPVAPRIERTAPDENGTYEITSLGQRILDSIAWWNFAGTAQPTREQTAFVAHAKPNGGHFGNTLGALRTAGLIDYPQAGRVKLTAEGSARAVAPTTDPTYEEMIERARSIIRIGGQLRIFDVLVEAGADITREELGQRANFEAGGGHFGNTLGAMRSGGLIDYPQPGMVGLSEAFKSLQGASV